jgi:hypothetical protein
VRPHIVDRPPQHPLSSVASRLQAQERTYRNQLAKPLTSLLLGGLAAPRSSSAAIGAKFQPS